jgi:chromosome partitioning protein
VLNLGAALARRGLVPLLVDLDAQSHLSSILNPGASSGESLFAYFNAGRPLKEVVRRIRFGGELIPAHAELMKVDALFGKGPDILNKLRNGLEAGWDGTRPVLTIAVRCWGAFPLGNLRFRRVLIPISPTTRPGGGHLDNTLRALERAEAPRRAPYLLTLTPAAACRTTSRRS